MDLLKIEVEKFNSEIDESFYNLYDFMMGEVNVIENMAGHLSFLFHALDSREKSVLSWLLICLCWALFQKDIRISLGNALKVLFRAKILFAFTVMFAYIFFILWLLYNANLWNFALTKDALFWAFGSATVLFMTVNKVSENDAYFKNILKDNLKLIVVLEWLVALHPFHFWVEMIFLPVMLFIFGLSIVTERKKEYSQVKKIMDLILSAIGIFLLCFAILQVANDYSHFVSFDSLRTFLLPIILSFLFIPFLYVFALCITYEALFVRIDTLLKHDKTLARFAKMKIFQQCFLNLKKLDKMTKESSIDLLKMKDKNDLLNLMSRFAKCR